MLVPYFAPQSHAAMFRVHKLAKYLPNFGYQPIIVTTSTNYLYNEDPQLLEELPSEVEIYRARYIEPTLRGIGMALGGPDRRFVALKAADKICVRSNSPSAPGKRHPRLPSLGRLVADVIGDWPDRYWTWSDPAFRLSEQLIKHYGIQLLYTSASPVSFLRAAMRLKQRNDLAWLFDSRDPLGYGKKFTARHGIARWIEQRILAKAIDSADHVSVLSAAYGSIFFDLYGLEDDRWSFIPTGLDEAYVLPDVGLKTCGRNLLYVGEVMANQSTYSLEVLDYMLSSSESSSPFDKLIFLGRREVNEPIIRHATANLPRLTERLLFLDHRSQAEVYSLMRQSRACLLVPGLTRYWWNNFAKLVDYIGLSVPVIAHVPYTSEARQELDKAGTAFFLGSCKSEDAAALTQWLEAEPQQTRSEYADRYTAKRQVADFAALFDRLLAQKRGQPS